MLSNLRKAIPILEREGKLIILILWITIRDRFIHLL